MHVKPLNTNDQACVFSASNNRINVLGKVDISVNFKGLIVPYTFLVLENLMHRVIFGIDILKLLHARIDLRHNLMSLCDDLVTLAITKNNDQTVQMLYSINSICIPPLTEVLLPVSYNSQVQYDTAIIESVPQVISKRLLAANIVVHPFKNLTFCRLLNPNNVPKFIKKHEIVASMSPIQIINNGVAQTCQNDSINIIGSSTPLKDMEKVLTELGLTVQRSHLTNDQYESLCSLLYSNKDIFAKDITQLPGTDLVKHHIDTGEAKPVRSRPYRNSFTARQEIARQIKEMAANDIIEPTMSMWSSPVILVKKPHSNELRFTVDYRRLNSISKPQFFPLPTLDEMRDTFAARPAKYYSLCDLRSGYHQCFLDDESKEKAAFCTSDSGNWAPKRMFFGLQGAPATFQALMMKVLSGLQEYSLVYVDDCCIFSPDWQSHLKHLQTVFDRFRQHNLRLHPKKCFFAVPQILYLGHVISESGIAASDEKVQLIKNYPTPKTQKQLRSALGLINYYRKFIRGYSKRTECLRRLLKNDVPFVWIEEHDKAFQFLKEALCSAPILAHADMTKQMILTCDGCTSGLGYILSFIDDNGAERVVEFAGRGLKENERKFGISEIECLAVLSGIQYFSPYLSNKKFLLKTDHSALQFLKSIKNSSGRLARWAIYLSQYSFDVQYTPGKVLSNADAISRIPYAELPEKPTTTLSDVVDEVVVASVATQKTTNSLAQSARRGTCYDPTPCGYTAKQWQVIKLGVQSPQSKANINAVVAFEPNTDVAKSQRECPDLADIIRYLETDELPENEIKARKMVFQADQFCLENDKLYHLSHPRKKRSHEQNAVDKQLCLPQSLREKFVKHYHDNLAHPGFQKLYETMKAKYWWPTQYTSLQEYVSTCTLCQMTKRPLGLHPAPLEPLPVFNPFDLWITDVLGPLPPDAEGHKYILVCCDSCALWPEAIPLKSCDAESTAEALYSNIFCRFGMPMYLLSDRGTNYTSKLMTALCKLCKVEQSFSTSYHHQTCGRAEQFMSSILKTFRLYCTDDSDWSKYIDCVLLSYRALNTTVTHLSPFEVLFSKPMRLPIDTSVLDEIETNPDVDTYVQKLLPRIETTREIARQCHVEAKEEAKFYYDKNAAYPTYQLGSKVLLFDETTKPGQSKKLKRRWAGPYFIEKVCPNYNFVLRHCASGKVLPSPAHSNRLRPFRENRDRFHAVAPHQSSTSHDNAAVPSSPTSLQQSTPVADDEWLEIHKLSKKKKVAGKTYYYVHWKDKENSKTWEPADNITPMPIQKFEEDLQKRARSRRKKRN